MHAWRSEAGVENVSGFEDRRDGNGRIRERARADVVETLRPNPSLETIEPKS
jgi:hypothetical protein